MKLYTSYWAQVKNFPKNLVALSTVVWEPKWYKVGGMDKNGIISLRCPPLRPGKTCDGLCNGKCNPKHPNDCTFLHEYHKQLDALDFDKFMQNLHTLHDKICKNEQLDDIDFAFIFFEKYDNPCSERWPVQDWFRAHGAKIEEWHPNI